MKYLILIVALTACGPMPVPTPPPTPCTCCWPADIHGPNRCRFVRAPDAPVDLCEYDPAQRCGVAQGGVP